MNRKYIEKVFELTKADVIISDSYQTRKWYADVMTSDGFIIIEKNRADLFVDGRYIEYAKTNARNVEVHLLLKDSLKTFVQQKKYQVVALEKDYLKIDGFNKIKNLIPDAKFKFFDAQTLRILKDDVEISKIQGAIDISLNAFDMLKSFLTPGVSEKEIDHKLGYLLRRHGAEKESFDTIVASGPNTAMPHAKPSDRILEEGDIVTIDFGAQFQGYAADITRTFILGGKEKAKDPKYVEILEIVEEAAKRGRNAVKPGISTSEIDKICREYIDSKGYGKYFVHSTGHGLGIDVHELPVVAQRLKGEILEPGMVITVEPGIYIEGIGGARIEDDVLVTETGHRVLSRK
ncbi:M24 family metallopeptidase [[Mycoplasma] mobile]|uniref:XAA-PRO dipeptidase n=1 Tax=Mycoplasma mobile (strain ATCC 43663 / 163K / NCTC 11711) TaxID=267748 RepID=Q6KH94_MYCM1|nr:aminopeptidase P family protein [[Mycoplasma] mobile]AAT28036.1 XAA-PRO dipeptidase [Mycoplasma mobile 163K]